MPLNTDFYTREEMGRRGWMWGKVEHYNHATGKKNDLWGLFDFLAMCPKEQLCAGIQSTTRDGLKKHQNKMEGEGRDALNLWLSCGNAVPLVAGPRPESSASGSGPRRGGLSGTGPTGPLSSARTPPGSPVSSLVRAGEGRLGLPDLEGL